MSASNQQPDNSSGTFNAAPPFDTSRFALLQRHRSGGQGSIGRAVEGGPREEVDGGPPMPTDGVTLGQIKNAQNNIAAKQKVDLNCLKVTLTPQTQRFDFRYDDTDTTMNELDEFYPYIEMNQVAQTHTRFEGSFDGDWTAASYAKRRAYIETQLEFLESPVSDARRAAQGRLLYLLQGSPRAPGRDADIRLLCGDYLSQYAAALDHRKCQIDPISGWDFDSCLRTARRSASL